MNVQDVNKNIESYREEILDLKLFLEALDREVELLKPKFESRIVQPLIITNLSKITDKDLRIDLIPIKLASMEAVQARKSFHYAKIEIANTIVAIKTKENVLRSYVQKVKEDLAKQAQSIPDQKIFDAYHKADDLKGLTPEEKEALKIIGATMMKKLQSQEGRIELLETLQLLITQHS